MDGVSSAAIMVRYLKNFTQNVTYSYHQRSEGHGISKQTVPEDTELLVICDSSTNDFEGCKKYYDMGMQLVVFDHHPFTTKNPYALIVNPKLDKYPNKELSGSGLCMKICMYLDNLMNTNYHKKYFDLCGCGIVADVMSMKEPENRYLVYMGLKNFKNPGLKAILKKKNIFIKDINSQTIAFTIAPLINGICRLNKVELALQLLLEDDESKCLDLVKEIIKLNDGKKKEITKITNKLGKNIDLSKNIIVITTDENLKMGKSFNGVAAMQMADKYKKPTLVLNNKDGILAGSGRSINDIPFKKLLQETGLCESLEGHMQAFGCEIKEENLDKLFEALENKIINNKEVTYYYDLEIDVNEIDYELVENITKFNYLAGKNAEQTKVLIKNIPVIERKVMGQNFDAVKLVSDNLNFVKFRVNEFYANDVEGKTLDVIANLNINRWYHWGRKEVITDLQGFIDDYKIAN